MLAFLLAACANPTAAPAVRPAPSATLRSLPTSTPLPAAAAVLPTDPPLPTFTPLPSATPLAYTVQKGDTLIGIAVRHDVTIEALEAANPGIDPGALQIGQTVLVPLASPGPAPNQAALPTPLPLSVAPFNCRPSPVASLVCLGEFVNTTGGPVANVSVRVSLPGPDGAVTESQVAYAPVTVIEAGQAAPMSVIFRAGAARQAPAALLTAESAAGLREHYIAVRVDGASGQPSTGGFLLTATLTNDSPTDLPAVTVVGTVYNATGLVIGYRVGTLEMGLRSGASLPITVVMPGVDTAARWVVIAQGRVP
jgi:LysM repeat protein